MSTADLLRAVLEPRRRAILRLLDERPMTVGDVARRFDVSRPAISQHLAVLRAAGLVEPPSGNGPALYAVRPEAVLAARSAIEALAGELPGDPADGDAVPAGRSVRVAAADAIAIEVGSRAAVETVFAHLTEPDRITRWLGVRAALEPRAGGRFRVELSDEDAAAGEYVLVEAPHAVVFTWGQEGAVGALAPGATRVEVMLEARAPGTSIRLEHRGLPEELRPPHLASWAHHLPALAAAAERDEGV